MHHGLARPASIPPKGALSIEEGLHPTTSMFRCFRRMLGICSSSHEAHEGLPVGYELMCSSCSRSFQERVPYVPYTVGTPVELIIVELWAACRPATGAGAGHGKVFPCGHRRWCSSRAAGLVPGGSAGWVRRVPCLWPRIGLRKTSTGHP